jgi:hypothetical protein
MSGAKRPTIKKILRKKINHWLETIKDEDLKKAIRQDVLVTGGAITSLLLGEEVNDYDIYFKTKDTAARVSRYYLAMFNAKRQSPIYLTETEDRLKFHIQSAGIAGTAENPYEYLEYQAEDKVENYISSVFAGSRMKASAPYEPVCITDNAISLSSKLQIIIRFFGTPEEIHKNFDYVHATNVYEYNFDHLHLNPEALEATLSKSLTYVGSLYPVASVFRMRKFIERGWRIHMGDILKILLQINELDLKDKSVLYEQIIGLDIAYIMEFMKAVEDQKIPLSSVYLSKVLDEVFG